MQLFGSDSDESEDDNDLQQQQQVQQQQTTTPSATTSHDDEPVADDALGDQDLFGDDDLASDDDGELFAHTEPSRPAAPPLNLELPTVERPPEGAMLFKTNNVLHVAHLPYDPEHLVDIEGVEQTGCLGDELADEGDDELGRPLYSFKSSENAIRWRVNPETRERESNARYVRWSDGSVTMHVGQEVLYAHAKPTRNLSQIYARNTGEILECQGVDCAKLTFRPASLKSSTHRTISQHTKKKRGKEARIQTVATRVDPIKQKQQEERSWADAQRLQASQTRRAAREDSGMELSADFLEADEDAEGDLGAIRKRFKKSAAASRRGARGGHGGEFDDDSDDETSDRKWDREERLARERGEMDDFIVEGSDDDESDEFGDMSEDEAPAPKKRR